MSEIKTIKNIDDDTWASFKGLAARNKMRASAMFKVLVREYEKKTADFWDNIFKHKAVLSEKEYSEFENDLKRMRKEHGWRI